MLDQILSRASLDRVKLALNVGNTLAVGFRPRTSN